MTIEENISSQNSTSPSEALGEAQKPLRDERGRLLPGQKLNPSGKRRREPAANLDATSAVDILRELLRTSTDRKQKAELAKILLPYEQPRLSTTEATDLQDNVIIIKLPEFPQLKPSDPIFSLSTKPLKVNDESTSNSGLLPSEVSATDPQYEEAVPVHSSSLSSRDGEE